MIRGAWPAALAAVAVALMPGAQPPAIDRHALVDRHNVTLAALDPESPLSVGNGEFAFTVDATGLQTFPALYEQTIPLGTQSQWGWHTAPNPDGWSIDRSAFREFTSHGRMVGYADIPGDRTPEINWLRANPHRLHLGRIGFRLTRADGSAAEPSDLTEIRQTLDLWNGVIVSHFRFDGEPVDVETVSHPAMDGVGVRIRSPLLGTGRVAIEFRFPYGTGQTTAADWTKPDAHRTARSQPYPDEARFARALDDDTYHAAVRWSAGGTMADAGPHTYVLSAAPGSETFAFTSVFTPKPAAGRPHGFDATVSAARAHWNRFWSTGGAIDLAGSADPRWREL
ncbi:MAG TPA: hypothetical protein VLN08_00665, partial [Vicinamibacterales bacterium]|nr:hypothetical protein [Vicinamibacterales bacterium]